MKFLKYFKEETDFKYYLWELPFSTAYFLNKYLETGNEQILKEIYIPLKDTFAWNKDSLNHWKELFKFNKKLPESRKIQIIGIDIEHQPKNSFKYMINVLPKNNETVDIIKRLKFLINKNKLKDDEVKIFCQKLKKDMEKNKYNYKTYLKENYFGFKFVNDNLLYRHQVYYGNNFNGIRDRKMCRNFKNIYNRLPKGKYFGQIGLSHVFQRKTPYVNWFASLLNSNYSILKGKVLSIAYIYENCKYLYPTDIKDYEADITTLSPDLDIFHNFTRDKVTIFKLNNINSPFKRKLIWPIIHKIAEEGVTTDYFQYIIIIKNSKAVTPISSV